MKSAPDAPKKGSRSKAIVPASRETKAAGVKAERIDEVVRLFARSCAGAALMAIGLLAIFWSSSANLYLFAVVAFAVGLAAFATVAGRMGKWAQAPRGQLRMGRYLCVTLSGMSGTVWGSVPIVLFDGANPDQRLVILAAMAVVATLAARITTAYPIVLVNLVPISIGSAVGFGLAGTQGSLILAAASPLAGWMLWRQSLRAGQRADRHARDRIGLAEQSDTIHSLLLNGDGDEADWLWHTDSSHRLLGAPQHDAAGATKGSATFESLFRLQGASTKGAQAIIDAMAARKPFRNELVEVREGERIGWWHISGKPLFDADGTFIGYQGVGSDASRALDSEARILRLSNFDALTGLANRNNFREFVGMQCASAAVDGRCRALLYLDLDDFKAVNDSFGIKQADLVLREVGARLNAAVPRGAFVARLGGDEFAVVLQMTTPSKAEACAAALIEAIDAPVEIEGRSIRVTTSVGIAFTPRHALEPDELLVKADLALYSAKQENRGGIRTFMPGLETILVERRKLEQDLRVALNRKEFSLHYQPILDVATGRVTSFEALIRWASHDRGFVSPAEFIPLAEATGLIVPIGRWVLTEACRTAVKWPRDVRVAVNISPPHLRSPDFLLDVTNALKASGLEADRLEIEVTEGVLIDKTFAAAETLQKLRARGIRIALDDFGTGYSSFNYLIDFPVDKIKIDRSFVTGFVDSPASQAIIDAILGLARRLSIRVTAEGVETKAQALALKRARCDEIQGYLLSRPQPAEDVETMIAKAPVVFRDAVPTYMDSPLAMAITSKRTTTLAPTS